MNTDFESIKCPICLFPFDAENHLPKIAPTCGHTVCKECLLQVLKMSTPKCPLDKLRFSKEFRTIDAFPTNFLGKDLLEMEGKWNRCEAHKERTKMICLTENTLVCATCVIFGEHKHHDIKMLSDFEDIIKEKKNQLSAVADQISKVSSEFKDLLEERKQSMKNMIKDRFHTLRLEITKQELDILLIFENIFIYEKMNLTSRINTALGMPVDVENKLKEFYDIMQTPNIVKLTQEDFSDLEKIFEEKVNVMRKKHTEEISELLGVFESSLPKEDIFKDFNAIYPLNQELAKFFEKRGPNQRSPQIKQVTLPQAKLKIFEEDGSSSVLNVQGNRKNLNSSTFSIAQLEEIKEINYLFQFDKDTIDEAVLSTIMLLSKFLTNLKILKLDIDASSRGQGNFDREFWHLVSSIFYQLPSFESIEEIDIDVKNAPIQDAGLIYLAEKIIPRLKNLKAFSCTLQKTQTTNRTLKAFSKIDFAITNPHLEKFNTNFKKSLLNDEGVIEFLNKVPNVKDLLIGFGGSPLTDKAFDSFSTNILPTLSNVKTFEMGFWEQISQMNVRRDSSSTFQM